MAGTRFLVHSLLGIFLLAATCSAQEAEAPAPSALAPLEATALAPSAFIIDANGPLEASFAESPFYSELAANPQLAGSSQEVLAVFNNPIVLEALQTSNSYDEFVAKLPEPVRPFANAIYNAPTTGNFSRDLANVVSSITGQLNNLGRRLLRVL